MNNQNPQNFNSIGSENKMSRSLDDTQNRNFTYHAEMDINKNSDY